ncbi:methyltransferase domain-containing protein [Aureococcus anophagefferens]|nr:methyltransferase domain-containing protein [Aureococcus anophagefferens]
MLGGSAPRRRRRGVIRGAVPFSNVQRRVKNVTPDLAVELIDKVRRIFDVKTVAWSAADSNFYSTAASARRGASPVDKRASFVDSEYKAHAKQIDVEINGVSDGPMLRALSSLGGCVGLAKALLSNELHREWGTTAAKYRARYLISGLKFADGTWKSKARALG